MSLRRLLPAALALALAAPSFAANEKGFVFIASVSGPGVGTSRPGWLDIPSSDMDFEANPGMECSVALDIAAAQNAPLLADLVGTTVNEMKVELTDFHGETYYKAVLTDSFVRKATSSSDLGLHVESLKVEPASIRFEVRKRQPNGFLGQPVVKIIACGPPSRT